MLVALTDPKMTAHTGQRLRDRLRGAPSRLAELRTLQELSVQQQKWLLEAWVAWLNSLSATEPGVMRLAHCVSRLLDDFDQHQKGQVDDQELARRVDAWMETAGQVGGPECEQDPTRPHPRGWHGYVWTKAPLEAAVTSASSDAAPTV